MFSPISSLIDNKKSKLKSRFENAQIPILYKEVIKEVYPGAEQYTSYKNLKDNILYISVTDTIWIQELSNYKEEIKNKINKKRKTKINTIKFSLN